MHLAEIHIFPVKGFAGYAPGHAPVEPWGLEHDRRWMVVDEAGRMLTQRVLPQMALIQAAHAGPDLTLRLPGRGSITVAVPGPAAPRLNVTIWRDIVPAALAVDAAHAWVSAALGTPSRLIHMQDTAARALPRAYAQPGESVNFADGYPVLLTSLASLGDLNTRLDRAIPISRFRANLVADGALAWDEDSWRLIRIGRAVFRVVKPCDRCIVTTIDQETGLRPDKTEPLRTLGKFRHDEHGIMFGQNLVPASLGTLTVGDAIEVLERGPPNVVALANS